MYTAQNSAEPSRTAPSQAFPPHVSQCWHRCPDGRFKPADKNWVSSSLFHIISFNIFKTHSYPSYVLLTERFAATVTSCTSLSPCSFDTQGLSPGLQCHSPVPSKLFSGFIQGKQMRPPCPAEPHTPLKSQEAIPSPKPAGPTAAGVPLPAWKCAPAFPTRCHLDAPWAWHSLGSREAIQGLPWASHRHCTEQAQLPAGFPWHTLHPSSMPQISFSPLHIKQLPHRYQPGFLYTNPAFI